VRSSFERYKIRHNMIPRVSDLSYWSGIYEFDAAVHVHLDRHSLRASRDRWWDKKFDPEASNDLGSRGNVHAGLVDENSIVACVLDCGLEAVATGLRIRGLLQAAVSASKGRRSPRRYSRCAFKVAVRNKICRCSVTVDRGTCGGRL
jgi:hypothetical protein